MTQNWRNWLLLFAVGSGVLVMPTEPSPAVAAPAKKVATGRAHRQHRRAQTARPKVVRVAARSRGHAHRAQRRVVVNRTINNNTVVASRPRGVYHRAYRRNYTGNPAMMYLLANRSRGYAHRRYRRGLRNRPVIINQTNIVNNFQTPCSQRAAQPHATPVNSP
jgi:hypothetical protein